jgi:hypothetical protein
MKGKDTIHTVVCCSTKSLMPENHRVGSLETRPYGGI